jgi:serine/threonine protein phosphatase PrpC
MNFIVSKPKPKEAEPVRDPYRINAATGTHRGDRPYQQDQVEIITHKRINGCLMGVVADGMGGKSGGRKAADQVILTAHQVFERFVPSREDPSETLRHLLMEAHLMIKLTAITAEEEPHSTLAAFILTPDRYCHILHAGDSRIYHFREGEQQFCTKDHSYVQKLVDEGQITLAEANTHPQSNLLTGCLGANQDPPLSQHVLGPLQKGDCIMACTDGLWHYFKTHELGAILHSLDAREAAEMLISKARMRARGGGDNLSLALFRIDALPEAQAPATPSFPDIPLS